MNEKKSLYAFIDNLRSILGLTNKQEVDTKKICTNIPSLALEAINFNNNALRGIAVIAENPSQNDVIVLNSNRTSCEQNYDCGHELIHIYKHRSEKGKSFNCFETIKPTQNRFLEWQANEGAAELLLPYKILLPLIKDNVNLNDKQGLNYFKLYLAVKFFVPQAVVKYRLNNLAYEIQQYLSGTPLDKIEILSNAEQKRRSIQIICL